MGTDAGEVDATEPNDVDEPGPMRRRSTFVPPPRQQAVSPTPLVDAPAGPLESPGGRDEGSDAVPDTLEEERASAPEVPGEQPASAPEVHDDDELAGALENEVSRLTASLPIIRPGSLFTPVRPPEPPFTPHTDVEREIAAQADSGDTLAAIERLEALIAGRQSSAAGRTPNPPADEVAATVLPETEPPFGAVASPEPTPIEPTPIEPTPTPGATAAPEAHGDDARPKGVRLGEARSDRAQLEEVPFDEAGSDQARPDETPLDETQVDADIGDDADDVTPHGPGLAPMASPRVRGSEAVLSVGRPEPLPIFSIEQSGIQPTPLEYRVGRASRLFWLWFATGASVLVVGIGAVLVAAGLNLLQVVIATALGIALSFLPLGLSSLTGVWSGLPTVIVSRATFGVVGNIVPAALILVVRLFWGAVLLWLLAVTVADAAIAAHWSADRSLVLWASFGVAAVVCVAIALVGYALVAAVQLIATIVTAALALALIVAAWPRSGWDHVVAAPFGQWIVVVEGAVLVFSVLGLAWASAGGDLARYQRAGSSGTASALWSGAGASLPMLVLIAFGGVVALARPEDAAGFAADPVRMLVADTPHWFAVPVVAAIAVGLMSALMVTLYSGGFAVQAVGIHLPRWASVLVLGVVIAAEGIGLLVAVPDVRALVLAYPTTLAVPVAAWTGIFLGDFLLRRRRLATDSLVHRGGVYADWRWANLLGLVAVTSVGLGFMRADAPWLRWEGYLYRLLGVDPQGALARSDIGVLIALAVGLVVGLCAGWRSVPAQESASR